MCGSTDRQADHLGQLLQLAEDHGAVCPGAGVARHRGDSGRAPPRSRPRRIGPGEPSAVTQLRKGDAPRTKRPPVSSVSYHLSCHRPSMSKPIQTPRSAVAPCRPVRVPRRFEPTTERPAATAVPLADAGAGMIGAFDGPAQPCTAATINLRDAAASRRFSACRRAERLNGRARGETDPSPRAFP